MNTKLTSPETFFGHTLGEDRKIARWDRIVEYFYTLETESDRIKVIDMGKSTEGHPFLLTIISSPENLSDLERLRQINLKITDPRGVSEEEVGRLIEQGKAIVCQSMSLHASEIGGTQMAPELAYDLLSSNSADTAQILDNVIFLMVPCFNPDGQIMVSDWYSKYVGTEYEGASLPWLYHKYAGHDNNRDAFRQNLVESQYMGEILLRKWKPHAFQDHHHMGSYGPRLFVAPYSDPIRPNADPLVWRELAWYGAHMAYKLEEAGKTGVINAAQFAGWGHLGYHWITPFHNIAGMLTESANAKLATPLYIHPSQLTGAHPKHQPKYEPQTNFPHPWPGGWWKLRDIVEQQKVSSLALLDIAARHKHTVLRNAYLKAKRQTQRGAEGSPRAYLITPEQHDPLTVIKLVRVLLAQGIEMHQAKRSFEVGDTTYPVGTYVISLAQPKMGVIKTLLGRTFYPASYWTRNPDGSPIMYDMATDTVAEFMGVQVIAVDEMPEVDLALLEQVTPFRCELRENAAGYVLDPRQNDSYKAVNRIMQHGGCVHRIHKPVRVGCGTFPKGAFYVEASDATKTLCRELSEELGLSFCGLNVAPDLPMLKMHTPRIGVYQRYWGGNMDEGWTRLLLEQFEFPYLSVRDEAVKGNLIDEIDVLILPQDWKQIVVDVAGAPKEDKMIERLRKYYGTNVPPEYKSGIGSEGLDSLKQFVEAGGRLVALDSSCTIAIDALGLNVRNVVSQTDFKSFYCHGSTLRARIDTRHPLGYGMPECALVVYMDSPTFEIVETQNAHNYEIIAEYPERDLLQSGLLIGEDKIAAKPAMLRVKHGKGDVVLVGFRTQHRAQTDGTFKLLFNCLI